jgi:hypothetical protein
MKITWLHKTLGLTGDPAQGMRIGIKNRTPKVLRMGARISGEKNPHLKCHEVTGQARAYHSRSILPSGTDVLAL